MRRLYRSRPWAWWLGVRDGWAAPSSLSMGMTWGDARDQVYDLGVNVGQRLGAFVKRVPLDPAGKAGGWWL